MYECPVCGSAELTVKPYQHWPLDEGMALTPPYEGLLGAASYEVCPNCGYEFGKDDNPRTAPPVSFEAYRAEWIAEGRPRFGRNEGNR
jgi:rRNA maturation protein Nop10